MAVGDTMKGCPEFSTIKLFSERLYAFYSVSAKRKRELVGCANDLGIKLLAVKRVVDTRWSMSSRVAIMSLLNNFEALFNHLLEQHNSLLRAVNLFKGKIETAKHLNDKKDLTNLKFLVGKMSNPTFVKNLCVLADCLGVLGELSVFLQSRSVPFWMVWDKLVDSINSIRKFVSKPGPEVTNFHREVASGKYHGVSMNVDYSLDETNEDEDDPLADVENDTTSYEAFNDVLITVDVNDATSNFLIKLSANMMSRFSKSSSLLKWSSCLNPANFPVQPTLEMAKEYSRSLNAYYLEFKIDDLQFSRELTSLIVNQIEGPTITSIKRRLVVHAFSSAEAERDFSCMKRIWNNNTASFHTETVSHLMRIQKNGPSVRKFAESSVHNHVKAWLASPHHRSAIEQDRRSKERKIDDPQMDAKKAKLS